MNSGEQSLPLDKVVAFLNSQPEPLPEDEMEACFKLLSDQNHIMVSDDTVFLI